MEKGIFNGGSGPFGCGNGPLSGSGPYGRGGPIGKGRVPIRGPWMGSF